MKKVKFLLPMLAFAFAIGGAFATEYFTLRVPTRYQPSLGQCVACEIFDGYEDEEGDIYDSGADDPNEYFCDDSNSASGQRCVCLIDNDDPDVIANNEVDLAAHPIMSGCVSLWKVFPEGDND